MSSQVIWWASAFFYVLSAITRLGFYNLHHEESPGFIGLPTTVAGLICSSSFLGHPSAGTSAALLLGCGIAMVSFIPIPRPKGAGMVAFLGVVVLVMILHGASIRAGQ